MHLDLVVSIYLITEYFSYLGHALHILTGAGPHDAILEPPIGSLNLPFGLGGEGIYHLDAKVLQNLLPLGVCFIGFYIMLSPHGVSLLNEAEYGMIIDIIGKR